MAVSICTLKSWFSSTAWLCISGAHASSAPNTCFVRIMAETLSCTCLWANPKRHAVSWRLPGTRGSGKSRRARVRAARRKSAGSESRRAVRAVDLATAEQGALNTHVGQLLIRNGEDVAVEDDHVGLLARSQTADLPFEPDGLGG